MTSRNPREPYNSNFGGIEAGIQRSMLRGDGKQGRRFVFRGQRHCRRWICRKQLGNCREMATLDTVLFYETEKKKDVDFGVTTWWNWCVSVLHLLFSCGNAYSLRSSDSRRSDTPLDVRDRVVPLIRRVIHTLHGSRPYTVAEIQIL